MQYNTSQYNESPYQYLLIPEAVIMTDSLIKEATKALVDTVFFNDNLTKQVTNKALFDEVRTADWLSKHRSSTTEWTDQ